MWPDVHAPAASDVFALVLSPMFLFIAQARMCVLWKNGSGALPESHRGPVFTPSLHKEILVATKDAPELLHLDKLGWSVIEWNTANVRTFNDADVESQGVQGILGVALSALFLPRSSRGYASVASLLLIAVNVYCHVVGKDYQHAVMGSVNAFFVYGMLALL